MIRLIAFATTLLLAGVAMAYEEPQYEVLASTEHYEIRRYAPYIVAEVDVDGDLRSSGNEAFRILAGYIFGNNAPGARMNMTAPVESSRDGGVKMRMTVPVESDAPATERAQYTYAFVMERRYTLDTLPAPLDERIRIREKPSRVMAAHAYSGTWSEDRYRRQENRLFDALAADRIAVLSDPLFARYNGPFTPWFMRRNEILVEVQWPRVLMEAAR